MSKEATTSDTVVTNTLFLNSIPFCVLFDSGVTHSFISTRSALQLDLEHDKPEASYRIKLPNDSIVDCLIFYKHVPISIDEYVFPRNSIQFDLSNFDIILEMKWLRAYEVKIDCKYLKVILVDEEGQEVCFYGQREGKPYTIISAIKASRLLRQGCQGYWCHVVDTQAKEEIPEDIPIVCKFKDVFPEELPGFPPQKEIDF